MPLFDNDWEMISDYPASPTYSVGESITYSCPHDSSIASVTCTLGPMNDTGIWTPLNDCREKATLVPIGWFDYIILHIYIKASISTAIVIRCIQFLGLQERKHFTAFTLHVCCNEQSCYSLELFSLVIVLT